MGIIQEVQNGQIVESTTTSSSSAQKSNDLGYDQFLQILCAEMQYQDPLEPTSNTDYIAQLATFTQVESMLNMQNTMTASEANSLVGKYVIMKVTSSTTGEVNYAAGNVDYVLHQNGKTYLSIGDKLYNIDDLDTVADTDYMEAVSLAEEFKLAVSQLPSVNEITLADGERIQTIAKGYNSLTEYQKGFIAEDVLKSFTEKYNRYNELVKASESAGGSGTEGSDEAGSTEGTEGTDSTDSTGSTGSDAGTDGSAGA